MLIVGVELKVNVEELDSLADSMVGTFVVLFVVARKSCLLVSLGKVPSDAHGQIHSAFVHSDK